jgi:hypothetical protein
MRLNRGCWVPDLEAHYLTTWGSLFLAHQNFFDVLYGPTLFLGSTLFPDLFKGVSTCRMAALKASTLSQGSSVILVLLYSVNSSGPDSGGGLGFSDLLQNLIGNFLAGQRICLDHLKLS